MKHLYLGLLPLASIAVIRALSWEVSVKVGAVNTHWKLNSVKLALQRQPLLPGPPPWTLLYSPLALYFSFDSSSTSLYTR